MVSSYSTKNVGLLSGLFGGLNIFNVNECSSNDLGWYCQFSRFFSVVMMIIVLIAIVAVLYNFSKIYLFKKNK